MEYDYNEIRKIIEDMGNSNLANLEIEFPNGLKIKMEKQNDFSEVVKTKEEQVTVKQEVKEEKENGKIITSPMVGTFYIKPSPNAEPYVEIGSHVKKGTVLCIIEAMKLMNEIESEYEGKIEEIYVKDGETVDYGKPLFRIV